MTVKKSLIRHRQATIEIFAARLFEQCEVVGSYYSSLVYPGLCRRKNPPLTYSECFMDSKRETFRYGQITFMSKS